MKWAMVRVRIQRRCGLFGLLLVSAMLPGCPSLTALTNPPAPAVDPFSSTANVTLESFVSGAEFPVGMVFLPDGSLMYVEKNTGRVRVVSPNGQLQAESFADFAVANAGDSGLLGVALDPNFRNNGYIYFSLIQSGSGTDDALTRSDTRVVRITAAGTTAVPNSEHVIVVIPASPLPGHEGGNVHFGPDGKLYLSIGDRRFNNFPNEEAQQLDKLAGRILRLNPDGTLPADNPYPDNMTFAYGLRNSFDFTFDPLSGLLLATENGPSGEDELNLIEAGMNYGWPDVSGLEDTPDESAFIAATPNYRGPLTILGRAPTGVDVNLTDTYGAEFNGDLFVAEYVHGTVKRIRLSADRRTVVSVDTFADGIPGGLNDLVFGPDGLIYISTSEAIVRVVPQ